MSDAVVELREVFCVHRTNEGDAAALQGTSLELLDGEVLCVLGPSGAGKSTLLRVIAGLQPPTAGLVHVLSCDMGRMAPRARARLRHQHLGFVAQHAEDALPPELRAREAVALPLAIRGVARRVRDRRVAELLDAAGLADRASAYPRELSGGERQRVAVCAAVAHRPALLLADEPTGELDAESAAAVHALIAQLARVGATSVIVVSHDAGTAAIADRLVRIRDGRVVQDTRHGEDAVVVDRSGWMALPDELLSQAGIRGRARVRHVPGGLLVTAAADQPPAPRPAQVPDAEPTNVGRDWTAASVATRSLHREYADGNRRRAVIAALSHEFATGRMTVVSGRSGTGKTTLLRLLAGLDRADAGELAIDGVRLQQLDAEERASVHRARIGYLPQEPWPVGFLTATENVVLGLRLRGWAPAAAAARAAEVLMRLGLAERAHQRVHRLSAGEAQRVALARALASARGLLIVDEPTSRVDEAHARTIAALLARAAREDGQTVICATHDPELTARADDVLAVGG